MVKEEVRVNVMNQPYGGFPWLDLPPVAFRNWANSHNFYGDFADLDAASLADVQSFFKTYYVPNNAVLLILGDVKPGEGIALAKKYFADIPAGPPPPFADPAEPEQKEERRGHVEEKFGTLPAMAIGYPVPPRRTRDWCAMTILDMALHGGRAGRLHRELVLEKQIAVEADGGIDDIFGYNGPTQMVTRIMHKPEFSSDATLAAFDEVISRNLPERHQRRRTAAAQSEVALRLLLHARRRPRRLHAAVWPDASARLFHLIRWRAATREYHSRRLPGRNARRSPCRRKKISAKRSAGHRIPHSRQRSRQGSCLMTTRPAAIEEKLAVGVPDLSAERAVTWPKQTKARLSNGLEVVLAEAHSIPKFHGELFFRSGNAAALDRGPVLADMTATVLRTGTSNRTSRQIEEDLRRIGADLSSSAGQDTSAIAFAGLSEFAEQLLGMVNELARDASFPAPEFERERRQKLEEIKLERTSPGFLASERLRKVLFGAHPYGQVSASEAQVAAYTREDLLGVYRDFYTPENALLLMVGDFDSQAMLQNRRKSFWHLEQGRSQKRKPRPPRRIRAAVAFILCTFPARSKHRLLPDARPSLASILIGSNSASPTACTAALSIRAWS